MIRKRRIEDTVILLVGSKLLTFTKVSDELWKQACSKIEDIHTIIDVVFETSNELDVDFATEVKALPEYKELLEILDYKLREKKEQEEELKKAAYEALDLDEKPIRIVKAKSISGHEFFETDEDGIVYLTGFSHPMHQLMVDAILDAEKGEGKFTTTSLINFWKYLLLNPDKHVRTGLFQWIKTSNFSITEDGNIIAYRNVDVKNKVVDKEFQDFVQEAYGRIKRWKKSPKNYTVYKTEEGYELVENTKSVNAVNVGILSELYTNINESDGAVIYTDQHTKKMSIKIGEPVRMNRADCDNDPNADCSRGLHNKSSKYSLNLGTDLLVTLVNPYNVVAIPHYDHTKFRSCEYLPIAKAEKVDGIMQEFDAGTYDIPYNGIETLSELLKTKSIDELQEQGVVSSEIDKNDFESILSKAEETISARKIMI